MVISGGTLAGFEITPYPGCHHGNFSPRYRGGQGEARETLKAAMKNRPPVAEIVKEITKVVKVKVLLKLLFLLKGERRG